MADTTKSELDKEQAVESIVELFHMVKSLIPEGQKLETVQPETRVRDALELMKVKRFSQLPVVSGNAVLGVFSYRSLAQALEELGPIDTDFRNLPVDEFMEQFAFVHPADKWESTLDHLNNKDGALVGNRNNLQGILTAWDVLTYLQQIANPFVMLAEIELSLRRIIEASVDAEQFKQCTLNSLAKKYDLAEMPASVSDMSFNDYVQIVGDGRNWPLFESAFGKGGWLRKKTVERLTEVRDLRNDAFHFRRQLDEGDHKTLAKHRDWLEMKSRAFEGRREVAMIKPDSAKSEPDTGEKSGGKTSRKAFLAACEPAAAEFYAWLLDEAKARNLTISWGQKGFAVRSRVDGRMASFAYGYPADSYNAFHIYLKKLPDAEQEAWRQAFLAMGVFQESGQHVLLATVTHGNMARLKEVFRLLVAKVKALTRYPLPIQATVHGEVATAEMLDGKGRIRFDGTEHGSPFAAGKAATGWQSVDGWQFWQYYDEASHEWRPIDDLRK